MYNREWMGCDARALRPRGATATTMTQAIAPAMAEGSATCAHNQRRNRNE